jgi:hypothetical protein
MRDVPSTAVFCSESIECFPDIASKLFFKTLVSTFLAPITTGIFLRFKSSAPFLGIYAA